ncbi:hypothetical protein AB204_10760 [Xenorhabdus khoisanae]|uniref:Uncharacterized protein n=1 Tax=Xenorhabdus khoisanae TaxID=880157 RepID=A0A0J5FSB7_9GAMM|nr:hypothetical protein [Xenorhabdus khoisanae]KMJ45166.1 hypothetical protein AB204_10760 [Xenorhabdus khoisanae]
MISKIKSVTYITLAVIAVLFTAYQSGGKAAKKSVEIKRRRDENERLQSTIDAKREIEHEIRQKDAGDAATELRNDWMR